MIDVLNFLDFVQIGNFNVVVLSSVQFSQDSKQWLCWLWWFCLYTNVKSSALFMPSIALEIVLQCILTIWKTESQSHQECLYKAETLQWFPCKSQSGSQQGQTVCEAAAVVSLHTSLERGREGSGETQGFWVCQCCCLETEAENPAGLRRNPTAPHTWPTQTRILKCFLFRFILYPMMRN